MGRKAAHWRSLDESTEGVENEFLHPLPAPGELGRRDFFGVLSALSACALAGCAQQPPEFIVPRARSTPDRAPGVPMQFATAVLRRGRAMGVIAESREGRPLKLEGNPQHPATLGKSDAQLQAELLEFYHPMRSTSVRSNGSIKTIELFQEEFQPRVRQFRESRGRGLALLLPPFTSPSLASMLQQLHDAMPEVGMYRHDPLENIAQRHGIRLALGRDADLIRHFDRADVIISFADDFLQCTPESIAAAHGFSLHRHPRDDDLHMNRLYVAESVPTITGASSDHDLPIAAHRLHDLLLAFAQILGVGPGAATTFDEHEQRWLQAAAGDAADAKGAVLILAGPIIPPELHALALHLNCELHAPIEVIDPVEASVGLPELPDLVHDLNAGRIDTLITVGVNPVYTAPGGVDMIAALDRAELLIHAGQFPDETAGRARWHIPLAHPLESWDDARAFDGTLTILQPTIHPLYNAMTPQQLVALLLDPVVPTALDIVRSHYARVHEGGGFEQAWRTALREGAVRDSAFERRPLRVQSQRVLEQVRKWQQTREPGSSELRAGAADTDRGFTLIIRPDPTVGDGTYSHNHWLQELAKPITKIVWSNALEISTHDAKSLGLTSGDVVTITADDRSIDVPAWVTPGHAAGCVSLTLGYGRAPEFTPFDCGGANAYLMRTPASPWVRENITISLTGRKQRLVTTQHHGRIEGADAVRTAELKDFRESIPETARRIPLTMYNEYEYPGHRWAMSIDLTACTGCSACTIACQAENNIPWVGPDQVHKGREMSWIRVDRYYEGSVDAPHIHFQPMPCMHCEKAPCEQVCPVGATQHSRDGLNEMIYNRCIGTRYCSNNCPYKVRRFNFHKYADDHDESVRMMYNPEVTVRARGVMEKCTYCVQRIRNTEIRAKLEHRPLRTDEIVTACQQACPTDAIVFGDLADADARVVHCRNQPHRYDLLGELNTRPRTTYLAAVRNPNLNIKQAESRS